MLVCVNFDKFYMMSWYQCVNFDEFYMMSLQFNFVGRILGPRGMTAKELEQFTGCKIMVRGKGSMRDKKKVRIPSQDVRGRNSCQHM